MKHFITVEELFPLDLKNEIIHTAALCPAAIEELRVKIGAPVTLRWYGGEQSCQRVIRKEDMRYLLGAATECSYHTAVRHMKNGYIPLRNGNRMGLCGVGDGTSGVLRGIDEVVSVCIRIASVNFGCADSAFSQLFDHGISNTIIIGPPGVGKTTLLRELIRKLSYSGVYVGVADERGEISGQASFDLGPRCDVLSGVPKNNAAMMLLRSMAPDVIAMDEITAFADMAAIQEAVGCGVGLLTTLHGDGMNALYKPAFRALYESKVFEKAVFVSVEGGRRRYEVKDIYD